MNKIRLAVLFGGASSEYEVSLSSAYAVLTAADRDSLEIIPIGITKQGDWYIFHGNAESVKDGTWNLHTGSRVLVDPSGHGRFYLFDENGARELNIDAAFPVMHGKFGEDGTIQGLLEMAGIPVVGSGCASSAVCMDKDFTKRILKSANIPQASAVVFTSEEYAASPDECVLRAESEGYPIFVKPARTGSSVGVAKAKNRTELISAIDEAFKYDSKLLCEKFMSGREIETAVLRRADGSITVSPCGEIDPGSEFYDYDAKYISDKASYFIPARIPDAAANEVRSLAARAFAALGCRGLARIDFFVGDFGVALNEVNNIPGFTPISMYPKLMQQCGITFSELITALAEEAVSRASAYQMP